MPENPELEGLKNVVASSNISGIDMPTREEFDTDEEYDFAMEVLAHATLRRLGES